jgi:hypothetical protein
MPFSREGKAMTTMETDRLVDDYLRRLDAAAAHLQRSRRAELVGEIREHIDAALREEEAAGEAAVRNVLERLGPPEEIVDAAEPPPTPPTTRVGGLELGALLALLVPLIGWLVGIVLVLVSQAWARRDKVVGIGLALLPIALPLLVIAVSAGGVDQSPVPSGDERSVGLPGEQGGGGPGPIELLVLGMFAGLPSALYLGWRLRRGVSAS